MIIYKMFEWFGVDFVLVNISLSNILLLSNAL